MNNKEDIELDLFQKAALDNIDVVFKRHDKEIREELSITNKFLPLNAAVEKKKNEFKEMLKGITQEIKIRIGKAIEAIKAYKTEVLDSNEINELNKDIQILHDKILNMNVKEWEEQFSSNQADLSQDDKKEMLSIKKILGISNTTLYYFYKIGYFLFNKHLTASAADIFFFNALLNPYVKDYWMALGIAELENQKYDEALEAFQVASIMDLKDPEPNLTCAEISLLQKNIIKAAENYKEAKERIQNLPDSSPWRERLEIINNKISEVSNEY